MSPSASVCNSLFRYVKCEVANSAPSSSLRHLLTQRANFLRNNGATPQNNDELAKIYRVITEFQQRQSEQHYSPHVISLPSHPHVSVSTPLGVFHENVSDSSLCRAGQEQAAGDHSHPGLNGQASIAPILNGVPTTNGNALTSGPVPSQLYPPASQTPVSFTPDQINALRAQIHAFKLISRGLPVPDPIQQAIRVPNQAVPDLQTLLQGSDVNARVVDSAVKIHKSTNGTPVNGVELHSTPEVVPPPEEVKEEEVVDMPIDADKVPKGPFLEDNVDSGVYPYNAYLHPFLHLKRDPNVNPAVWATRMQRLLIPSIMPVGLDPHQVIEERNAYIDARIDQRMRELEALPAMMSDGGLENPLDDGEQDKENAAERSLEQFIHPPPSTHGKLRALIELKALRVLDKQRALRASVAERLMHGSLLPLNRVDFRRTRKVQLRDIRATEAAERKQRADRERRAKQKHIEQLGVICTHGREVIAAGRAAQDRISRLGKAVLSFHSHTEKEEQKRIERLAKERLKALKNDDEEAYMKLIDTAKDTRITHLIKQTDAYLDSLAQAVVEQQRSDGHEAINFETEEGPVSEETFGAKAFGTEDDKGRLDYYGIAHRVKEKISQQPTLLIGGTLKDYQLKGLQWMVSLYNNKLNGILADEMVSASTVSTTWYLRGRNRVLERQSRQSL